MKTENITFVFKELISLNINSGIIMEANDESIAIIKREDRRGVYYTINNIIDNIPQKPEHNECAMTLLLLNQNRFKHTTYKSRISLFH
jgi:hypothetical protein